MGVGVGVGSGLGSVLVALKFAVRVPSCVAVTVVVADDALATLAPPVAVQLTNS